VCRITTPIWNWWISSNGRGKQERIHGLDRTMFVHKRDNRFG
jgi:hypothetical protein